MKNFTPFLLLFTCLILSSSSLAQNNVQFKINHKLSDADFAMETPATNNLGHDFEVTRLEYYISELSITHDGGIETAIEDLWILVDASEETQIDLGDHDINNVEKVSFYIGVDSIHNHSDPAIYPDTHALAPQFPSMHWGWIAGYRFVAFEGYGSSSFNQLIELHGLDDRNYFQTEVLLDIVPDNNTVIVEIDADYTRALENIGVNSGIIVHGGIDEALLCLENFRDFVFSPVGGATSTFDFSEISNFSVFPNPSSNGSFTLALEASKDLNYQVSITDILGRQIQYFDEVKTNTSIDININKSGFYFVNLIKEQHLILSEKMIIK